MEWNGMEWNGMEWNGKLHFDMVALSAKAGVHRIPIFKILQLIKKHQSLYN